MNPFLSGLFGPAGSDEVRKRAAWLNARPAGLAGAILAGADDEARIDDFGNLMLWSKYGHHSSEHGWEIDHRTPSCLGGSDDHSNLRALNCRTNRGLGGALGALFR